MVFHLGTLMPSAREAPPSCRLPPITGGRRSYHLLCSPSFHAIQRRGVALEHGFAINCNRANLLRRRQAIA